MKIGRHAKILELIQKNERVRSKSEKIIADMLYHKNIPYKYECPINLKAVSYTHLDVYKRQVQGS